MNHKNITTLISRIALEQDDEIQPLIRQFSEGKRTGGTPMGIRFRPAVREFITRVSQRIGISASELVNILVEGVMIDTLAPRQSTVRNIYDRFWLLMEAHRLNTVTAATLLADVNMGLSVLESRERTLDYLTLPVLRQLAKWFSVCPSWLECTDDHPVQPVMLTSWHDIDDYLRPIRETCPKLTFVRKENKGFGGESVGDDIIICISLMKQVNGIHFCTIEFTGVMKKANDEIKETGAFLAYCETLLKSSLLNAIEYRVAPEYLFTKLASGDDIPLSILSVIHQYHKRKLMKGEISTWNPSTP
ncbi:conjugal transfer protein TraE [Lonsdalea quercina]|uniref:conjugal transfer protein TraE n=1 Tax=Lonsdalea quercina TaxID=71657 RepID=UPI0039764E6A